MAGDWIKMRGNLWDDPRVSALVDATDTSEATVVGALYWLWATADQHTEDGLMPGLTLRQIDRKTGVQGFGEALCGIGWIVAEDAGVRIVKFEEHNGASAKKRGQTAKRVANHKTGNAPLTQPALAQEQGSVIGALPRGREEEEIEKDKETSTSVDVAATPGEVCKAMKATGLSSVNPSNPRLQALLKAGMSSAELVDAASDAVSKGKPFAYALATAEGRRRDAAIAPLPSARNAAASQGRNAGDLARTTVLDNPDIERTSARLAADAAIPRNGPTAAVRAKLDSLRKPSTATH